MTYINPDFAGSFAFSRNDNHGRNIDVGLSFGSGGLTAYYSRNRHGRRGGHHGSTHYALYAGVSHHVDYHHGHYYPYGYLSTYDYYYYRYPYHYSAFAYVPTWTVYVDRPVNTVYIDRPVETVYIDQPNEPVYIDDGGGGQTIYVDPEAAARGGQPVDGDPAGGAVQVEPQDRIPVNNAHLATAGRAFSEGNYAKARDAFVYAVLNDPSNGFAELAYAVGHFALGEYDAAARAVRRGLALVPDVIDRPIDIARQYGRPDDFTEHLKALEAYLSNQPDDQDAWFLLGYIAYSGGKPADAIRALEKAASLDPQDAYAAVLRDAVARVTSHR